MTARIQEAIDELYKRDLKDFIPDNVPVGMREWALGYYVISYSDLKTFLHNYGLAEWKRGREFENKEREKAEKE